MLSNAKRLNLNLTKKILTDFKKLKTDLSFQIELYLYYCDCLTRYLQLYANYGCWFDVPDFASKYNSLEKTIEELFKIININQLQSQYHPLVNSLFVENINPKEELRGELAFYIKDLLK